MNTMFSPIPKTEFYELLNDQVIDRAMIDQLQLVFTSNERRRTEIGRLSDVHKVLGAVYADKFLADARDNPAGKLKVLNNLGVGDFLDILDFEIQSEGQDFVNIEDLAAGLVVEVLGDLVNIPDLEQGRYFLGDFIVFELLHSSVEKKVVLPYQVSM